MIKEFIINLINNNNNNNNNNNPNINSQEIFNLIILFYLDIRIIINEDKNEAFKLFINRSKQGHLLTLYFVGICYQNGFGTIKNEKLAFNKRRICENCNQERLTTTFCDYCVRNYLKTKYSDWTSENNDIDNLKQKYQTKTLDPKNTLKLHSSEKFVIVADPVHISKTGEFNAEVVRKKEIKENY
ncbi:hypothetical protein C1645_825256 [Glomus cerebriforme]|uniref:Uncharacterized protein n=1 Tax=Glomus cerebriforme TaxID=658196 RepID=A0A397STT2_9GLOM|nr:hypothetical protein C1645_825256 [Glomus cerebriforme]